MFLVAEGIPRFKTKLYKLYIYGTALTFTLKCYDKSNGAFTVRENEQSKANRSNILALIRCLFDVTSVFVVGVKAA